MPICCLHGRVDGGPGGQPRDLGAQLGRAIMLEAALGLPSLGLQARENHRAVGHCIDRTT
jgi:hypothetical protein